MIIKSSTKNYEVKIGTDFEMAKNLALDATCFVVVDSNLYRLYKDELFSSIPEEQLYVMEAVEEKKTIETALDICEIMTNIPAKRNARLISFGGGIVRMLQVLLQTYCTEVFIGLFIQQRYWLHVIAALVEKLH